MAGSAPAKSGRPHFAALASPGVWRLDVWVQPGAARSGLAGEYQGRLKVRVAAPANDNKANKALVGYLAGVLEVKKSQVKIGSGHASRKKTLFIESDREPSWAVVAREASDRA